MTARLCLIIESDDLPIRLLRARILSLRIRDGRRHDEVDGLRESVYSRTPVKYTRKTGSWPMLKRAGVVSKDRDRSGRWMGMDLKCSLGQQQEIFRREI